MFHVNLPGCTLSLIIMEVENGSLQFSNFHEGIRNRFETLFFPQRAIAIGVLTSNKGGGDEPLWRIGRGTRVPLQGAVDVVPLLRHRRVPL